MWISYMCLTELTIIKVRSRSPPTWIQNSRKQLHLGKTVNEQYLLPGWRWEVMINHVCADSPLLAWFHGVAPFHETVIEQRNNVCYNPSYLLVPKPAGIMDINFFLLYWHVVVSKLKLSIFCERKTPRIREMISFELGKEIEKDVFRLVTSLGQRKKSESPWVIEPQTFGFRARMLYHLATETTVSAESEGLRFDSSWGLRSFSFSLARDKKKNILLYFFTELKTYHISYSNYKHDAIDVANPSSMQDACHMNFVIDFANRRVSVV